MRNKEQQVATPGATPPGEDSVSVSAESSRPRELLTSNQRCPHGISLTANPPCHFCEHERVRAALQAAADSLRNMGCAVDADEAEGALSGDSPPAPQAPIFRVVLSGGQIVGATPLAPGLPDGEFELYCEPEKVAPYLRSAVETLSAPHCKTCECLQDNEPQEYTLEHALNIARLWRAGKMIGGDEDAVIFALLLELERRGSPVETSPDPLGDGVPLDKREHQ